MKTRCRLGRRAAFSPLVIFVFDSEQGAAAARAVARHVTWHSLGGARRCQRPEGLCVPSAAGERFSISKSESGPKLSLRFR